MTDDYFPLGKTVPPRDNSFIEICRYIMQSAEPDYPALSFVASLYTYAKSHNNCLTFKQIRALDPHCQLFLGYGCYSEMAEKRWLEKQAEQESCE